MLGNKAGTSLWPASYVTAKNMDILDVEFRKNTWFCNQTPSTPCWAPHLDYITSTDPLRGQSYFNQNNRTEKGPSSLVDF